MSSSKDPLDRQLGDLPVVRASTDFTRQVLRRVDELPVRSFGPRPHLLVWAAVTAGIAALALLPLVPPWHQDSSEGLTAEVTEIRLEHELLTQELDKLRARTEDTAPVLYLGGVDEIDYVLDLSPFIVPQTGRIVPAATDQTTF